MDWLEERVVRLQRYIRDLSFRKAMIAYILVLSVVVFGLSYLTIIVCWQWEMEDFIFISQKERIIGRYYFWI